MLDATEGIGIPVGIAGAALTFIASWIYCMSAYGFLFGFGLGWLPSAILAVLVGFALRYLWPIAALILVAGAILLFVGR